MPPRQAPRGGQRSAPAWTIAACFVAWSVAVVVTLTGSKTDPVLKAAAQALVVGCPMVVGLVEWRSGARFPRLLVAVGAGLAAVALSASDVPLLYSTGRVALWLLVPGVVYTMLAYPAGRLGGTVDRTLAGATAAVVVLLYLPTVPFTPAFPAPLPLASCGAGCPENAFAVVESEPAIVADGVRPLREALTIILMVAVAGVVARRAAQARPLLRSALVPVLAAFAGQTLLLAGFLAARGSAADDGIVTALGWGYLLSFPVLAVAFAAGRIVRTLQAAQALERLAHTLRAGDGTVDVGRALASALRDPSMRLLRPAPADGPAPAPGSRVTPIDVGARAPAMLVHDEVLDDDPDLLRAAGEIGLLKLDNEHLVDRLQTAVEQLSESRVALVEAGDRQRRQVERDLHDGAQQGLISLRIRLSLLEERLRAPAPAEAQVLEQLGILVEETIEEVRSVARGIYPPLLAEHGLAHALRAAARTSALPVTVDVRQSVRYRATTENTIYFTCLEALQNAAKHATGATAAHVRVWEEGDRVEFEVTDDGPGFDGRRASGSGLANMRNRVAAVGGTFTVRTEPGRGTCVGGTVPLTPDGGAAVAEGRRCASSSPSA